MKWDHERTNATYYFAIPYIAEKDNALFLQQIQDSVGLLQNIIIASTFTKSSQYEKYLLN